MNDKQLNEIKKHRDIADKDNSEYEFEKVNFYNLYADSLIEQVERVHELKEFEEEYVDLNKDFTDLALENKQYREALDGMRLHAHQPEIIKQIYDEVMEEENE